ncbi:MAG: hypothetical protein V1913_18835, partial [Fibrobacterota bacterium]
KTVFNPGCLNVKDVPEPAEWLNIVDLLEQSYNSARNRNDFSSFENYAMKTLIPLIKDRGGRDVEDLKAGTDYKGYQCGSLKYNLCADHDNPKRIGFHIANACFPGSIFDDKTYLPACFIVLLDHCEAKFGISEIGTASWLNSHPKWNNLFPDEWKKNMGTPTEDVLWSYGWWGQFINSRKTFNHKLAEQFKTTGKMPYLRRYSWCRTAEMRKYLKRFFV